ncbi:ATP-binding protein [Actinomadura yumaensis]|uniref:ATP-binding protein n=1 Tax=Actinomadura yumaensis TaxID=111807 RepID=UPI00361EE61A
MELNLDIRLPRDSVSVPAVRGLLEASLRSLGVLAPIREDIELMLTEACTNVIKHAQDGDDYTVRVTIMNARCILKVIDTGTGFDADEVPEPSPHAEHGRGLMIIQALADDVRFRSFPHNGALVALEKRLRYWEEAWATGTPTPDRTARRTPPAAPRWTRRWTARWTVRRTVRRTAGSRASEPDPDPRGTRPTAHGPVSPGRSGRGASHRRGASPCAADTGSPCPPPGSGGAGA